MNAPARRWSRVDELYHELLSLPPKERAAALAAACPDDPALAAEVQSLLDQPASSAGFLVTPILDVVARVVSEKHSPLTGRRIGAFEIQDLLATGGMGDVYQARDTRLGRKVAVKVLPEAFAYDHERLARFNREAQALASINHPNIAAIYGIEEMPATSGSGPGARALVMELVEGEDLSARIARGPLPASEALPIARQIAQALEAAHEHGIVHRDLKPANIKVRADGTVKVLDFGLAKVQPMPTADDHATAFHAPTRDGAVMGTPGYMSPEQIRGQRVDSRSDLFAFGVVLYEMLAGRRAFAKGSDVETLHAALTEAPPDLAVLAPRTNPALTATVTRCLEKNPEDRFQTAKDLGLALQTPNTTPGLRVFKRLSRLRRRIARTAALLGGLAIVGFWLSQTNRPPAPTTFHQITSDGHSVAGDLSPDGETLAYVSSEAGVRRLMIRDIAGGSPVEILRSETGGPWSPRWSHAGRDIAVAVRDETLVTSRFGGTPIRIPRGAVRIAWSPDDRELILGSSGGKFFWIASIQTREVRRVEIDAPVLGGIVTDVSPKGDRLLLYVPYQGGSGVWSVDKDGTNAREHVSEKRRILDARWAPDGASFYYLFNGGNVSQVRHARVLPDGPDPSPVVVQDSLTIQDSGDASIAISRNGKLAYPKVSLDRSLWQAEISPSLSSHEPLPLRRLTNGPRHDEPRFSPDGTRLVFTRQDGELGELVIASGQAEIEKTLVSRKGVVEEPAWSPDGESVAYAFEDDNGRALHVANVGSGADRTLRPVDAPAFIEWAPGARLAYRAAGSWPLTLVDPGSGREERLTDPEDGSSYLFPRYSNRGDRIALWYNARTRKGVLGLAVVSLHDRAIRVVRSSDRVLRPVGWSANDTVVYAIDGATREFVAVRADGQGLRTMGVLPSRLMFGQAIERGGALKVVLGYINDHSDLWVVDNFDGGRR